jgi:hypothetical protein
MIVHAQEYAKFILNRFSDCKDNIIGAEFKVDLSKYIVDGHGTVDAFILASESLNVFDYKYGQGVLVSAYDNPQLKLYALGILNHFASQTKHVKYIYLHIIQPRRQSYTNYVITRSDLMRFGRQVKAIAKKAYAGKGDFVAGAWCQFCKGRQECKARSYALNKLPAVLSANTLTTDELAYYLPLADQVEQFAKDVKAHALSLALQGQEIKGYKLANGLAKSKIADEESMKNELVARGFDSTVLYQQPKMIPLGTLKPLVGSDVYKEMENKGLIIKTIGSPVLVPVGDQRAIATAHEKRVADFS